MEFLLFRTAVLSEIIYSLIQLYTSHKSLFLINDLMKNLLLAQKSSYLLYKSQIVYELIQLQSLFNIADFQYSKIYY